MNLIHYLDKSFYPQYTNNWDDKLFREKIESLLTPSMTILDVGAGAGILDDMNFKDKVEVVIGIDLDHRVETNPFLDKGIVGDAASIPVPDNFFDIVFCDNVFEHIEQPQEVFEEIYRVLKNGGLLLFKTPNKYHYMTLIARLTPHKFHQFYNRIRGRKSKDTFPTRYLINSEKDIKIIANATGFKINSISLIEGRPEYLRILSLTYLFGFLYERLVNKFGLLKNMRILIIGVLKK